MDAGKPREALAEVRLALSLFPLKNVALHKGGADGKMVYEAERFGSLLIRAGNAAEDTEAVAMGRQILQTRLNEQKQWREYINSLPMRLRPAVSYSNRVGVARIDTVRNLLNYIH